MMVLHHDLHELRDYTRPFWNLHYRLHPLLINSSSYQVALVTLWDKTLTSRHGNSMRQDPEMGGTKNSTLHYCIAGWIILGQSIGDLGVRSCEYSERGKHYFYNRTIG
jgi:hypothetical protein